MDSDISLKRVLGWTVGILVFIGVAFWVIVGLWADASNIFVRWLITTVWQGWLFPNGWNLLGATPFFWLLVAAAVFIFLWSRASMAQYSAHSQRVKAGRAEYDADTRNDRDLWRPSYDAPQFTFDKPKWLTVATWSIAVAAVASMFAAMFMHSDWNARFYNQSSIYQVQDVNNLPNSLTRISEVGRKQQVDIETGDMPSEWVKRAASSTGAAYVMRKTGDSNNNTELLADTITYVYNKNDEGGAWTAVRNGTRRQPIFGVSSWAGTGEAVKTREFKGDSKLNYAFHGTWGKNLNDKIAQYKRDFIFDDSDMYGYCDDGKPVIVIPGMKVTGTKIQAASTAYGVLMIRGSASGEPVFDYRTDVQPGELPGPVYPLKLVQHQRDSLTWSAGRVWWWQPSVGYEAVGVSDLLLKSKVDGRLYWVTPLKPNKTDSQTIVAYAMVPADVMTSGQLNQQRVYVLNDGDSQSVNFNDLTNAVTQAVAKSDPGFFTGDTDNQGSIVEFVPTSTGSWQVFAERGGRAVYKIEVSGGQRMRTSVIAINEETGTEGKPSAETPQGESSEATCATPTQLSDDQIASCIQMLANEMVSRRAAK